MADSQDKDQLNLQHPEEGQEQQQQQQQQQTGEQASAEEVKKSGFFQKEGSDALLGSYGNKAGNAIESGLSPVGNPVGKGFETVARPVGGLVDPIVGGVMRFGAAHGEVAGVGAGNMDKRKEGEQEKLKEGMGGKEQTAENPLGL